jgi:hypothetical protein
VLIDGGADLEAPGGSIGTPLENAIGYACLGVRLNRVAAYASGTSLDAAQGSGTQHENVITWLRELGAQSAEGTE